MTQKKREDVGFRESVMSLFSEMAVIKTDISWIKRLLFLILGIIIANLFIRFMPP